MTPQFTIQDGYLKELPRMKEKVLEDFYGRPYSTGMDSYDYEGFEYYKKQYAEHTKSLRTYRLANPSDWDNVPMPIGEDGFEVRKASELFCNSSMKELYAIPTQPEPSLPDEDDFTNREGVFDEGGYEYAMEKYSRDMEKYLVTQPAKGQSFSVTREQLEDLWNAAGAYHSYIDGPGEYAPDMETYINQLLTPKQ